MAEKFIVAVDRRHVRIYQVDQQRGQWTPSLKVADALEILDGVGSYSAKDTDVAGRFPGSRGGVHGMSIDERLPMQEEYERRIIKQVAGRLNDFLRAHPEASWDFAAGPSLHNAVLEKLDNEVARRVERRVEKELTKTPPGELLEHFVSRSA